MGFVFRNRFVICLLWENSFHRLREGREGFHRSTTNAGAISFVCPAVVDGGHCWGGGGGQGGSRGGSTLRARNECLPTARYCRLLPPDSAHSSASLAFSHFQTVTFLERNRSRGGGYIIHSVSSRGWPFAIIQVCGLLDKRTWKHQHITLSDSSLSAPQATPKTVFDALSCQLGRKGTGKDNTAHRAISCRVQSFRQRDL